MWSPINILIRVIVIILCFLFVNLEHSNCQEFELLYAKPEASNFTTSKGSKNIAFLTDSRIMLTEPDKGNIVFIKRLGNNRRTDFVTIDDQNNKLYIGYRELEAGYRVDVYDTKNNLLLKRFSLAPDTTIISDISPDNKYVVVVDNHYNARIYDLENDALVFNFQEEIDKYTGIYYAKFSNNGKKLAVLTGTKIAILNLESKAIENEINSINYHVHRIAFTNSDDYILKYNYGPKLEIFAIATGEKIKTLEHNPILSPNVRSVVLSENDSLLISRGGQKVYFWDFNKGLLIDSSINSAVPISILKLDNKEYLVAGWDSVSLWDIKTRLFYKAIAHSYLLSMFVGGGSYFISRASTMNSKVFATATGEKIRDIGNSRAVFKYLSDTSLFYYYEKDTIYFGDIFTGNIKESHYFPVPDASSIQFSDNLDYFSYVSNDTVYVYDWKSRKQLYKIDSVVPNSYKALAIRYLLFSKKNRYVAGLKGNFIDGGKKLFLADGQTGNIIFEYNIPLDTILGFLFSNDEKYLFFRIGNDPIRQMDIEQGKVVKIFDNVDIEGPTFSFQMCVFPDRPWIAVGSRRDPRITIIDYNANKIVARFDDTDFSMESDDGRIYSLDVSNNGNYLLASYWDNIVMRKVPRYSPVVENPGNSPISIFSVSQNSNTSQIQININLHKAEQINFYVYDLLGRRVHSTADKEYFPGVYSETLDLSHLSNGLYILVARVGTDIEAFKINIAR